MADRAQDDAKRRIDAIDHPRAVITSSCSTGTITSVRIINNPTKLARLTPRHAQPTAE